MKFRCFLLIIIYIVGAGALHCVLVWSLGLPNIISIPPFMEKIMENKNLIIVKSDV